MTEEFEIIDTSKLQLRSLTSFAAALGYHSMQYVGEPINFYSSLPENKHRSTVSFNVMVRLHNGGLLDWHGARFRDPFAVDTYRMRVAQASKIVHKVKLMYSKRNKRISCQDYNVAFCHPDYEYLFLGK